MSPEEAVIETVVVTGVVGRVVWGLWTSGQLNYECVGLVLLTFVAGGLELFCGTNKLLRHLKPRSCTSSGFVLGAVTLPLVLSTRLAQLLRSSGPTGIPQVAVDRLKFEFWLALACSSSMLMMMVAFLRKHCQGSWVISTFLEYSSVAVLIFLTPTSTLNAVGFGVWTTVYILGGKALFRFVLEVFPFSGTVGEVMLVVEGISLYGANAVAWSLNRVSHVFDPQKLLTSAFLQGVILGVLMVPLVFKILYEGLPLVCSQTIFPELFEQGKKSAFHVVYRAALFYGVLSLVVFTLIPKWAGIVVGVPLNPLSWAIDFLWQRPVKRLLLCIYWGAICALLPTIYRISSSGRIPTIIARKMFHVMVVFMFVPALIIDPGFLEVAFGVALAAFLVMEMIRVWSLPPFGYWVEHYMTSFTDHRDSGVLIISHFSLLLGCALPVWLNSGGDRPMASFAGILSLGVGDTMASVIGYNFGHIRVSPKSKKTLEGTVSGILSVLVCAAMLIPVLGTLTTSKGIIAGDWTSLVVSTVAVGILEAYTLHLDNAFVPLLFYSLLCI